MDRNREAEVAGGNSLPAGGGTVLLVEDQEIVREFTSSVLEEEGYRVVQASSGAEALRIAADPSLDISLLITDIVMPRMSGAELARRLEESRPGLRTLFVSGYACDLEVSPDQPSAQRAFLPKPWAFLPKPYTPEQLCDQVALMVKPAARAGNELPQSEPVRTMNAGQELEPSALDGAEGGLKSILADRDHDKRHAGTIVVADDDPQIRDFLRTILTEAGYQVLEAENGIEAMRQVESFEVDLMITDLAMPKQEGIETIRKLHGLRPQLKIIAMSGQFQGSLLRISEHLGAQESLAKPIDPDELLDVVARVMTGCEPRA